MVEKLTVRGEVRPPDSPPRDDEVDAGLEDIGYHVVQRVDTTVAARDGGSEVELEVAEGHILEITDTNGVTTFLTAESARREASSRGGRLDLAVPSVTRGTGTAVREVVQSTISAELVELGRGVADWGLDRLLQPAARVAVRALADRLDQPSTSSERGHARVRGLHRVDHDLRLGPESLVRQLDSAGDPFLVLLHGTFSNTEASFGGLLANDHTDWDAMLRGYPERLLALEHPTLGLTPVENAVVLARALPEGARLHLLSHSRGGLVGEALSCAAQGRPSMLAYERRKQQEHPDVAAWAELSELMRDKGITVERFIRAACPARGTILASRKVDRWASYFFNALKLVPGLDSAGVLSVVKKVVLVLLEQHVDVRAVPGLECMVPESALVATLAGVEHPVADGLFAVMGDLESKGLLGRIALALPNLFFEGDHDLVVNTSAMDGGMPRTGMTSHLFRSSDHTHFGYFRTPSSREAIRKALAPPAPQAARGARGDTATPEPEPKRQVRRRGESVHGPTLVIVPDLMGSVLRAPDETEGPIWPSPGAIARRGVTSVVTPAGDGGATPGLAEPGADALVAPYDDLVEVLRHNFVVRAFPYDWRRPLAESTALLRGELDELLGGIDDGPGGTADCLVLGHGVGALLALEACAGTGLRPVLLDPPFEPRPGMSARADGRDDLTRTLALVDGEILPAAIGQQLAELDAFQARRTGLDGMHPTGTTPPLFVCVHDNLHAGHGHLTLPCQHYLSRAPAGSILTSPEVLQDLRRLALGRNPVGLVAGQPSASPPAPEPQPGPERELLFPTADELARLALGIRTVPGPQPVSLLVRVTHGDLRVGDGPWIVGAQDGTPIGGSEKALDQRLDGALATHRILGQYPGPAGTVQLFTGPDLEGAAAAVIGLGAPGELTPGQLTTGVTQAVLRLAAANVHVGPAARQDHTQEHRGFEITCALAGTVGSGALPIETAVNAIITGVRRANRKLRDLQQAPEDGRREVGDSPAVVGSLQLVELYEDRAVLALQAATSLAQTDGTTDDDLLQVVTALQVGVGGRKGSSSAGYLDDRWRTIKVTASASATIQELGEGGLPRVESDDVDDLVQLTFTEVGRSAGAETTVTSAQRRVVDQVIRKSIQGDGQPARQTHNTLYELLVPLHMKGQGRPSDHIMFILDAHAASLPLEMLATRAYDDAIVPLAAEVGIVRRLETTTFRQWVRPASGRRALVVGDPRARGWPPLAGARLEANRVADSLEAHGYAVERQISASDDDDTVSTTSVLDALFAHDYRIIHIAAHGEVGGRPGVIIGERDRLTALEIQQMQTTPDLVFLNCCHLASTLSPGAGPVSDPRTTVWTRPEWRPDRFAAGISRQLVDNGVRAVVAAGWAVADDAAATFAGTFYDEFLSGRELGPATLTARKVVLRDHAQTSTWGAYQVYGPPAMTIQTLPTSTRALDLTNPKAVRDWLGSLARRSARLPASPVHRQGAIDRITEDLEAALAGAPEAWIDGDVQQTIGEIWRNLGNYSAAISSFQGALETWSSVAALNVVDQLVSAHVRLGADHARKSQKTAAERSFAQAQRVIKTMQVLGRPGSDDTRAAPAPERLKLVANFEQHRLWVDPDSLEQLQAAHRAFEQAADAYDRARRPDRYCRLGEMTLRWTLRQRLQSSPGTTDADIDAVATLLRTARRERWSPRPFAQLGAADCMLVHALLSTPRSKPPSPQQLAAFTASVFDVTDAYRDGFRKGVSERERASVLDYLELLQRLLPPGHLARTDLLALVAEELT